jgi:hypothetical protein
MLYRDPAAYVLEHPLPWETDCAHRTPTNDKEDAENYVLSSHSQIRWSQYLLSSTAECYGGQL